MVTEDQEQPKNTNVEQQQSKNIVDKRLGGITGKGFMPGVSGNPKGRPPVSSVFKEKCRERGDAYLKELDAIAMDKSTKLELRVDIMKWVIEHGYGRPVPAIIEAETVEARILVMDR